MKDVIFYLFAIAAGIFTTLEATINANLGKIVTPKIATLHSLITGVVIILLANLLRGTVQEYGKVLHVIFVSPYWLIGGIFGTGIIYLVTKTIPKLGITLTLTLVIASQILSSLYIDAFILKHQQIDLYKLLGVFMLVAGAFLIVKQ